MARAKSGRRRGAKAEPVQDEPWRWEQILQVVAGPEADIRQSGSSSGKKAVYGGISFFLHMALGLWISGLVLSPAARQAPDVLMVDLVAARPSASRAPEPAKTRAMPVPEKKVPLEVKSLSSVEKEQAHLRRLSRLAPKIMEKEPEKTEEPMPETPEAAQSAASDPSPSAAQGSPGGGGSEAAYLVAAWKSQVMGIMDMAWQTPSLALQVDISLKTTYLLRISRDGELLDKKLVESSGNPSFDRTVQLALESTPRFPTPPDVLMGGQENVEITMSFSPPGGGK